MPINSHQQRNLERLLQDDHDQLRNGVRDAIAREREEALKALDLKLRGASGPFEAVNRKVKRYQKVIDKKVAALNAELEAIRPGAYVYQATPLQILTRSTEEAERERQQIIRHFSILVHRSQNALQDLYREKEREILLATLTDVEAVLAMPTTEEIVEALKEES